MGWMQALYETYDANLGKVGHVETRGNNEYTLLPISHSTQTAHIEVVVTDKGEFHSAKVLDKVITLMPASDSAASRSGSKIAPYPLHDKLSYVAGDLGDYGGGEKEKSQFEEYIKQ